MMEMQGDATMGKKVTLKDIALASGYSVSTVSHALKGAADISGETKQYIVELAKRMGYVRNAQAQALRTGCTKTIGVITANVANPYFSILTQEIEQQANNYGYSVLLFNTYGEVEREYEKIQQAMSKNVDGMIIGPAEFDSKSVDYLRTLGVPYVMIGRSAADEHVNYVAVDDEKGSWLAVRHLIQCGRRRILYLSGDLSVPSSPYRLNGYRRALAEAGISPADSAVRYLDLSAGCCERALQPLLKEGFPYDGIFCYNDMIACEVFYLLYSAGIRVPEQVGVVGFDDIQRTLRIAIPLDSISTGDQRIGTRCVDVLVRHIQDPQAPGEHIVLDVDLVDRRSVRVQ